MPETLCSLDGLGAEFAPFPELPEFDLGNRASFEARAEEIREGALRIKAWVGTAMTQLGQIDGMSREARELAGGVIEATRASLRGMLSHEVPACRRAAWLACLNYEFSRELCSREEVERLLGELVEDGRLVEQAGGKLNFYGRTYVVSPDAMFGNPEVAEVRRSLSELLSRVYAETEKAREDKNQELRSRATISCQELAAGWSGTCALDVPDEQVWNRVGQSFWRGGGLLFVRSDGKKIMPLDATGPIEEAAREAKEMNVYLSVNSLEYETPPCVGGPRDAAKKIQLLWHLVKRALRAEAQDVQGQKAQ